MTAPIALQLYSVREELKRDFEGTLAEIVDMGYTAVETGEFAGEATMQAAYFDRFGLQVAAAHVKPPVGEDKDRSLDFIEALGTNRLVVPWLDPKIYFQSTVGVSQAVDLLNEAAANAWERGLLFHYHNHDFEFGRVDSHLIFDIMQQTLDPRILFEIDTYWAQTAGTDAAELVKQLGARAPLLHIKDGPLDREMPMVAVGYGRMDFEKVIAAGEPHTEWLIVELDRSAGNMMDAVARSYEYLADFPPAQTA